MVWIACVLLYGVLKGAREILKKKAMTKSTVIEVLVAYTTLSFLIVIATSAWEICAGTMPLRTYLFGLRPGYYAAIAVKSFVIFVAWICGFRALRKMPVSVYGILDMARVVFSALLGILVLGERPSLMQAGGIVLVCLGLFLLRFVKEDEPTKAEEGKPEAPAKHNPGFYVALAMVSCFLNAVSGNMDKILMKDDRMSSGQLQLWYMFFLVAFYVIYTLARRIHLNFRGMLKNPWIWGLSILFVIADRALFIANGYAESRVIVMTVLKQACTIVTILGGWLVFREKKILRKLLCAAVVIAGIVLSVC
ncbi:MAG: DMT family transporter [Lachnospiraceae bacterium]|nr:DMT family transporter [Lachnospiraceae bacterium]